MIRRTMLVPFALAAFAAPSFPQAFAAADTNTLSAQMFQARQAGKNDPDYQRGMSALDEKDWDSASEAFRVAASHKSDNADAALYWMAMRRTMQATGCGSVHHPAIAAGFGLQSLDQ